MKVNPYFFVDLIGIAIRQYEKHLIESTLLIFFTVVPGVMVLMWNVWALFAVARFMVTNESPEFLDFNLALVSVLTPYLYVGFRIVLQKRKQIRFPAWDEFSRGHLDEPEA